MKRALVSIAFTFVSAIGCFGPQQIRLAARPGTPAVAIQPGEHDLGLGDKRDGTLYVPRSVESLRQMPLMILMHGGGQSRRLFRFTFPIAEEVGVAILTLDSRDNTWDAVDAPFGRDVIFIDRALQFTFDRVAVDPRRLALGGFSDGGSYALSLGLMNGDLFSHLVAFSPGFIITPAPRTGQPSIFVSHGTRDNVLGIDGTSRHFVPQLQKDGYSVTYREFNGPHTTPPAIARAAMEWLAKSPTS